MKISFPSRKAARTKRGQTLVEYSLILSFISIVAIAVLAAMGIQVKDVFTTVTSQLSTAGNGGAPPAAPARRGGGS